MKKDILKVLLVVVLLAILGLFFAYAPEATPDFGPLEIEYGSIEVEDQYDLDQVSLLVDSSEPGFVVVYSSMGDAPGAAIGNSDYFEAGTHDLDIALTESMIPTQKYITILHIDNGDEKFVLEDDKAARVDGEVVRPHFNAWTQ